MAEPVLQVQDLSLSFASYLVQAKVLDNVGFQLGEGELLGLAGESGCGTSVTTYSILRLLPEAAKVESGRVLFNGGDLLGFSERQMQDIRGKEISIVFQDPNTALNPAMRIGKQIVENYQIHMKIGRREAGAEAVKLLDKLRITHPERRMRQYAHQLSGGIKQRICFAMALIFNPKLLIADEFTTNLDVTIQAEMLKIVNELRRNLHTAILFITHDLSLIYQTCDSVAVMYAGQIVEKGSVARVFQKPLHPYTRGLLAAVPTIAGSSKKLQGIEGFVPNPVNPPRGCRFHPRCPSFMARRCDQSFPQPAFPEEGHQVNCYLYG